MKPSPPVKANIVRPGSMDSDTLGQYIADQTAGVLRRLEDLRPFYEELWGRFDKLPKGQKILDCRTRTEYCEKILNRSIRSVQHALYGRRSLNASVRELVDGLQSKQLIEKDLEREELEQEEEARKVLKSVGLRSASTFNRAHGGPFLPITGWLADGIDTCRSGRSLLITGTIANAAFAVEPQINGRFSWRKCGTG